MYAEQGRPRCGANYLGVEILAADLVGELYAELRGAGAPGVSEVLSKMKYVQARYSSK